jgi:hypothetical protein
LGAALAHSRVSAVAYLLGYLTLRLIMGWTAGVWGIGDPVTRRNIWLIPLRDLSNFAVWVAGFFSDKISWRGLDFSVKDGILVPLPQTGLAEASVAVAYAAALNEETFSGHGD